MLSVSRTSIVTDGRSSSPRKSSEAGRDLARRAAEAGSTKAARTASAIGVAERNMHVRQPSSGPKKEPTTAAVAIAMGLPACSTPDARPRMDVGTLSAARE
jgi:hypothetical protein